MLFTPGARTTGINSIERQELGLDFTSKAAEIIAAEKKLAGQYGGRTRDIRVISTTL